MVAFATLFLILIEVYFMYLDFYKLKEKPFSAVPDTAFLFKTREHSSALEHLLYGVRSKDGFMLITGDVGTGKTTLCRKLLHELNEKVETALIFNPPSTPVELIKTILQDLGLDASGASKKELLDELNSYLLKCASEDKRVIIIIDEAQDLPEEVLEEIRLLSNLETEKEKLLQIILSGQEELLKKLSGHSMRQLYQRISIHYQLKPLKEDEVASYIQHRLLKAGSSGEISFTKCAVRKIFHCSRGIPRMINLLCDNILLAGYVAQKKIITAKMAKEAAKNTCCVPALSPPLVLKLSYSVMSLIIIGLITTGFLTGAWSRLIEGSRAAVTDCFATVYIPDPLIKKQWPLKKEAFSSDPEQAKVPALSGNQANHDSVKFDIDGVMRGRNSFVCAREALATILGLWNVPEETLTNKVEQWPVESTFSFHDHARQFNLRVTATNVSIQQLTVLDYPCIIPIQEEHFRFTVLAGINEDRVILLDPKKGKRVIPRLKFQNIWSGRAFYVWRDFDMLPVDLQKGDMHSKVITIKKKFNMTGLNITSPLTNVFDEGLDKTVRGFQAKWGLDTDGVFGVQTKLAFYRSFYPSMLPELEK